MLALNDRSRRVRTAAAALFGAAILAYPLVGIAAKAKTAQSSDVETRIHTLHTQLRITPEQETAWKDVAAAMRDNSKTMEDIRTQQAEKEKAASAPDVINAYGQTMDAHAQAIHKFATAFQSLYDGMSAPQKKTADEVFRHRVHQAAKRQKS